jgi:hypothetical protein
MTENNKSQEEMGERVTARHRELGGHRRTQRWKVTSRFQAKA